ncbi:MAG: hypothetical protein U5L02_09025 [Rheinheimera sp.]|nr:hypothetical protein [Rheinheimera sp.]
MSFECNSQPTTQRKKAQHLCRHWWFSISFLLFSTTLFAATNLSTPPALQFIFADKTAATHEAEIQQLVNKAYQHYQPLFQGYPRDLQGVPYQHLQLSVRSGDKPGGEADPGQVSLTISDQVLFGYASWQTLLLHEVFHLWNAESFRYASQQEQWFNEGITDYYAYRTACRIGLISPQQALSIAALPLGYYSSAKQQLSMRAAADVSKKQHYFLIYNGGWVVAMVLDFDIRKRSQGKHSLDDLMRWLYQHKPRHQQLYQLDDLVFGLKQSTGLDYQSFFNRYVHGTAKVPVADYFDLGRAAWQLEFNEKPSADSELLYQTLGLR